MKDLWDEEETDKCRERFINTMYKFPSTPSISLCNGRKMPVLGVATWLKHNVQETVEHALRSGFRCGVCVPAQDFRSVSVINFR